MTRNFFLLIVCLLILLGSGIITADPTGSWIPSARGNSDQISQNLTTGHQVINQISKEKITYIGKENLREPANNISPSINNSISSLSEKSPSYEGYLVRYDPNVSSLSAESYSINSAIGAVTVEEFSSYGIAGLEKVIIPDTISQSEAIEYYEEQPGVLYAEPDYIWSEATTPNDPSLYRQWGLINSGQIFRDGYPAGLAGADIDAAQGWNLGTSTGQVIIAVIDTGVDYLHPDLAGNIWTDSLGNHGYDILNGDSDPMDDNGHGTHCAGVIGAVSNNGIGISGIAWKTTIMPVKALDSSGNAKVSDIIKAIDWAESHGATIISCSFGSYSYSQAAYDAISSSNALFACAAGNSGSNNDISPFYPASYTLNNIISVTATNAQDILSKTSNYGSYSVHIAAPGENIYSTLPVTTGGGTGYGFDSGTSMATPVISAMAGMIKSLSPSMTNREIRELIVRTADPVQALQGKVLANGRANLYNALLEIQGESSLPLTTGWNFLSVPRVLSQGSNTAVIFSAVPSGGHSILTYDPVSGWKTLRASDPIRPLEGYWIYSETPFNIPVTYASQQGTVSKQVYEGWNTYGLPVTSKKPAKEALISIDSIWTYLVVFNPQSQQYNQVIIRGNDDTREVEPYYAGWLYCTAGGTLTGL